MSHSGYQNRYQPNVKNIVGNIISKNYPNIQKIVFELEKLVPNNKSTLSGIIVSYHFYEAFVESPIIRDLLNQHQKIDNHTPMHLVNWKAYNEMKMPYYKRTLSDILKTINILYEHGFSPLEKNKHGETAISSLNMAQKRNMFPNEYYIAILNEYTNPPIHIAVKSVRSILNKLTPSTKDKYNSSIRWLMTLCPHKLAEEIINMCMVFDHRIKRTKGVYDFVKNFIDMISNIFSNIEISEEDDFKTYFDEHSWNAQYEWELLKSYITQNILNYEIDKIDIETKSPVMLGSLMGECGDSENIMKFIENNLKENNTNKIMIALACYAHSQYKTETMKISIKSQYEKCPSHIKFLIDDIFGENKHNNIAKIISYKTNRISKSEINLSEFDRIISNTQLIQKINNIMKQLNNYDNNPYNIILESISSDTQIFTNSIIDDIFYSLCELIKTHKTEKINIISNIIIYIIGQNITQNKIQVIKDILITLTSKEIKLITYTDLDMSFRLIKLNDEKIINYVCDMNDITINKTKESYSQVMSILS